MKDHKQRKRRLHIEWRATALIAVVLLASLIFFGVTQPLSNVLYDHLMRLQGFRPTHNIVIIAVDDQSLEELGGWPLARNKYTQLLDQLDDACCRPKSIGFDLLFLDATRDDEELAVALKKHRSVLPIAFQPSEHAPMEWRPTPPVSPLAEAATLSHINLSFDSDGVIRGFQSQMHSWEHFALAMQKETAPIFPSSSKQIYQRFRMVDPSVGFPVVSLVDAIQKKAIRTLLKDQYVLIGATSPSLGDRHPTLYSGKNNASTPGVAILASVLNASINHSLIKLTPTWGVFLSSLPPLLLMLQGLLVLPPRYAVGLASLISIGAVMASYALLTAMNQWLDPTPLIAIVLLLQMLWAWRRLAVIVDYVQNKAADLKRLPGRTRQHSGVLPSREVVLQNANLLDHAVASAQLELNFLAAVVNEMPDSVVIFDATDKLLLCNQKVKQLFASYEFVEGSDASTFVEHIKLTPSLLSRFGDHHQNVDELEAFHLSTSVGHRDFIVKTAKLNTKDERDIRLIILMDVTELRRSQMQRDRALQFLSHDMRTPIASILSLTHRSTIRDDHLSLKVTRHAETLLAMMDDFILTISSEETHYKISSVLLDNLINDAIEEINDLASSKKIHLRDESNVSNIFVSANTRLLLRALINLLFNAIKFSPPQSLIQIKSSTHIANEQATVSITITNEIDSNESSTDDFPSMLGFGLGLDFVNKVIQRHGGSVNRLIPANGMATVKINLPCDIAKNPSKS